MNANDPIDAMLAHLDGGTTLAPEHVARWRSALLALQVRGPARARFKAFESALARKPGKGGRPRKQLRTLEWSNRWRAVLALRACKKATGDENKALRIVAKIFGEMKPADLAKWSKDHRIKHQASKEQRDDAREACERYITDAVAYYERHAANR